MSLFGKVQSYLGVDIGAHGIKMVELKKTKGRPQLWTYGIADEMLDIHVTPTANKKDKSPDDMMDRPIVGPAQKEKKDISDKQERDIDKYAALLKELWKKSKCTTTHVTASLPVSQVFHAVVALPQVNEKELDHHVQAKVKKMLPQPIEEMQVIHQTIPKPKDDKSKDIKLLVTASPKELIQFYSSIFSKANLQLQELETEAFALERSLVGRDKAVSMIVDMGAERTNFFIVEQGLPITNRSIQTGGHAIDRLLMEKLGASQEDMTQIKNDISRMSTQDLEELSALFTIATDPIIKEIQYSFNLFLRQTGNENKRPEKIILTGGSSAIPIIRDQISKSFQMKVFVGDPWARVVYQQGLKGLLDSFGPRMSVAIGLAMRNIV